MNSGIRLSQKVKDCQARFYECLDIPELSEDDWLEQKFAEFNWWTSGLNADKTNRSSLDQRLTLRPDVKDVIADLLDGLITSLSECKEIATPDLYGDQSPLPDPGSYTADDRPGSPVSDDDEADSSSDPYAEQRYYIETNLEILLRIHTAIKRSGLKFRNKRADDALKKADEKYQLLREQDGEYKALNHRDIGDHERFRRFLAKLVLSRGYHHDLINRLQRDISVANSTSSNGPTSRDDLVLAKVMAVIRAYFNDQARLSPVQRRLIEANVTRRNRFLHAGRARKANHGQITQEEADDRATATLQKRETKSDFAETVVTQSSKSADHLQVAPQTQTSSKISDKGKERLDQNESVAQSATALGSNFTISGAMAAGMKNTNSVATKMSATIDQLDYPKCPARDGPFECPLCPERLSEEYTQKERWRAHVAQDLNPYVCIFEDCPHPDELYTSTYEWMSHIANHHSVTQWVCQLCSKKASEDEQQLFVFPMPSDWIGHMVDVHQTDPQHPDLTLRLEASKRSAGIQKVACPLCQNKLGSVADEDDNSSEIRFPMASTGTELGLIDLEQDKHIANHIHEFALQSLPWNIDQFNKSNASFCLSDSTTKPKISIQSRLEEGSDIVVHQPNAVERYLRDTTPTPSSSDSNKSSYSTTRPEISTQSLLEEGSDIVVNKRHTLERYITLTPPPSSTPHFPDTEDMPYIPKRTSSSSVMNIVYILSHYLVELPDGNQVEDSAGHGQPRRAWHVTIQVNDNAKFNAVIRDPFSEHEYQTFERYLFMGFEASRTLDDHVQENRIREYGEALLSSLQLENYFSSTTTECQIYINNGEHRANTPDIHRLAWELLETTRHDAMPNLRVRVTRIISFPARVKPNLLHPIQYIDDVQRDEKLEFRILLVIARAFRDQRVPKPSDLAQWPLMNIQRKLKSRMVLEVVRPGSREELEAHLKLRASQGMFFHLVHFDLDGVIRNDEYGTPVPWLLFANPATDPNIPDVSPIKAESIAKLLAHYRIESIVINGCVSAYNRSGSGANLTNIFLDHGIRNVSAMWFYTHWQTIATYLDAFYRKLLVQCEPFHLAAQGGREAIRESATSKARPAYQNDFIFVNYKLSPTDLKTGFPEASLNPGIGKSRTAGLGEPFDRKDPVLRLKPHLLQLEYQLMEFRIIYASDLRRPQSKIVDTIDQMARMWLDTNLFDEVRFYSCGTFGARRRYLGLAGDVENRAREVRTRKSAPDRGGNLIQRLFPAKSPAIPALRQALHVVSEVDDALDPGIQASAAATADLEERSRQIMAGLERFAERLHADGRSYMILLGSQDASWWRNFLGPLKGTWWLDMPLNMTMHSRAKKMDTSGELSSGHIAWNLPRYSTVSGKQVSRLSSNT